MELDLFDAWAAHHNFAVSLRESRESPEEAEEEPEREESRSKAGEAQRIVQRPWWRRVFGK
jgi:hypothetical protein